MTSVLVVEDELLLRRIIARNLAIRGNTVVEADSVATADDAIDAFTPRFDVILLDINLPDQTGWDVLRHLRARPSEVARRRGEPFAQPQVIMMSAVRPAQHRIDEFHPAAILLKPFPIDALLRLVARVAENSSPRAVPFPPDVQEQHHFPEQRG